jgi:hypothetical protein
MLLCVRHTSFTCFVNKFSLCLHYTPLSWLGPCFNTFRSRYTRWYCKVSGLLLLSLPWWKKMSGEVKVTLLQAYCISLPHDTELLTCIVFTWVLFWLHVSFCLQWMVKSSNMSTSSFAWSSAKSVFFYVQMNAHLCMQNSCLKLHLNCLEQVWRNPDWHGMCASTDEECSG